MTCLSNFALVFACVFAFVPLVWVHLLAANDILLISFTEPLMLLVLTFSSVFAAGFSNLPLLTTILLGRANLAPSEFYLRKNETLFGFILGLMDVLRPHIFHFQQHLPVDVQNFESLLAVFLDLFGFYEMHGQELVGLLSKFSSFLRHYLLETPERARLFLEPHIELFEQLHGAYPDLGVLTIAQAIRGVIPHGSAAPTVFSPHHVTEMRAQLLRGRAAGIQQTIASLRDLDRASLFEPSVLELVNSHIAVWP